MNTFLKKNWNDPGTKVAGVFALIVAVIFSIQWSVQEHALNLWPALYALCFYVFLWLMSYLFRNNP